MVWSYPRGESLPKEGESAVDVAAYAVQIAALIGAHIIKVKLPSDNIHSTETKSVHEANNIRLDSKADRVSHCVKAAFNGRRIIVFSGGAAKSDDDIFDDARAIRDGGGNGSIIGRNSFQRPFEDAVKMLGNLISIYRS